ncbi:MAG: transcription-repair coupling factor [Magnetococcales bacterium]|nr:transcription-repair coupling factor [Magnetococcales bacterium]HIJ82848.1 transcription-repair coupling factor [Magnetococcales bacterium]
MDPSPFASLFSKLLAPLPKTPGHPFGVLKDLPGATLSLFVKEWAATRTSPLVIVTGKTTRAEAIYRELLLFQGDRHRPVAILPFPAWEILPFEPLSPYGPIVGERIATLYRLTQMLGFGVVRPENNAGYQQAIIITTPMALMQRLMPRHLLAQHGFAIRESDQIDLPAFKQFLIASGYRSSAQIEEPGEFAARGGIIDLFPPGYEEPVRVELFGDQVETIRHFDIQTQRSTQRNSKVETLPMSEVLLTEETIRCFRTFYRETFGGKAASDEIYKVVSTGGKFQGMERFLPLFYDTTDLLVDYLPEGSQILLDADVEPAGVAFEEKVNNQRELLLKEEDASHLRLLPVHRFYITAQQLFASLAHFQVLQIKDNPDEPGCSLGFDRVPDFFDPAGEDVLSGHSVVERVVNFIQTQQKQQHRIVISTRSMGQRDRVAELLADHGHKTESAASWQDALLVSSKRIQLVLGDLASGFVHAGLRLAVFNEDAVLGTRARRKHTDPQYLDRILATFRNLKEGSFVVHADHGIGCFGGLHTLAVGGIQNDFLLLTYAGSDKLYVPVENLDRVSKYAGSDEVILDKLGGTKWKKTRQKVQKKLLEMAAELVEVQAKRETAKGIRFSSPHAVDHEFATAFPYDETPDQAQAIEAVLSDMASLRPMDRLICGDVGFGKTEVALRAAFRCVMDGKQVAVLTPTTILAQQHYETFSRRFSPYPVNVAMMSRFRTAKQMDELAEKIGEGKADIVIGTHRLLQKDIAFKDLGLLIVDEEQRFGVSHKERIKAMRANVDILTLTATPIPRTLHMAMSGIRDISIIATPPTNRLAIRTFVTEYNSARIREAILREIYRGGQVFYVFNKVQEIERMAIRIAELVPEAKIGIAHGQMPVGRLERIMVAFYRQEFNLLLCTTIIENGVDIPSANTIIIHRADHFGLAQLHQLRGRVGRSRHRAYAYLLTPPIQAQSADARKRLEAIEALGELGSGFMLASHDMEIRGVGNVLGEEQSGHIKEIGFELYNQMLKEAVEAYGAGTMADRGGSPQEEEIVPIINLNLSTNIPDTYITDMNLRLTMYKRVAELKTPDETAEMKVEFTDRFGSLPDSVENLLKVVAIKRRCIKLKVLKLEAGPKGAVLTFHSQPNIQPAVLIDMIRQGGGSVVFNQEKNLLTFRERYWEDPLLRLQHLERMLDFLGGKKSGVAPTKIL